MEDDGFDDGLTSRSLTPEPVDLIPGRGRVSVEDASNVEEQTRRLSVREDQLREYSRDLSENGWVSWKRVCQRKCQPCSRCTGKKEL